MLENKQSSTTLIRVYFLKQNKDQILKNLQHTSLRPL